MMLGTSVAPPPGPVVIEGDDDDDHDGREPGFAPDSGSGTVTAFYGSLGSGAGVLISEDGQTCVRPLSPRAALDPARRPRRRPRPRRLAAGLGSYRVKAASSPRRHRRRGTAHPARSTTPSQSWSWLEAACSPARRSRRRRLPARSWCAASCGRCARSRRPRTTWPSCRSPPARSRCRTRVPERPHRRAHRGRPGRRRR